MRIGSLHASSQSLCCWPAAARAGAVDAELGGGGPPTRSAASRAPRRAKVPPPPALPGAASERRQGRAILPTTHWTWSRPTRCSTRSTAATSRPRGTRSAAAPTCNGHNILGMTPMELSVDLGRNDISFLLLSMRGADDGADAAGSRRRGDRAPSRRRRSRRHGRRRCRRRPRSPAQPPGPAADRAAVQRRRRCADPECRLPGVRFRPALIGALR